MTETLEQHAERVYNNFRLKSAISADYFTLLMVKLQVWRA